jgi:heat-inducible transcriptional repressor
MGSRDEEFGLSARDRAILKDVILTYILNAEPVSSRAVAKHGRHGLSAATIRNTMADLEELGLLSQPHTSAGRVPTRKAYHLYIGSMMDPSQIPQEIRARIDHGLESSEGDPDHLMAATSQLLSELSHQVGILLTPALAETVLKTVEFVHLSDRKVLCVVVSTAGFVDKKVIQTREPLSREKLARISNYVTENFSGLTVRQIRDRLLRLMAEERAQMDRILALTIELAKTGLDIGDQEVLVDGTTELLSQPELADIERVRCLFEKFSDKARLVYMLTECMKGHGVRVLIGEDSDLTSDLDFSLVTTTYGVGESPLGTLGVFGPSRMEYQRTIPLVHYLGERLSLALASTFLAKD